jgi:4'-phosphopantetheinyl transferase
MIKVFYTEKYLSSSNFLFDVLNKYYNLKINESDIIKNKYGKPYLKNTHLFYNISHTQNIIVIAVSNIEMGIDAEKLSRKIFSALTEKFFKNEYQNPSDIIKLWAIKESFIKYIGKSVILELKHIKIKDNKILYNNKIINVNIMNHLIDNIYINIISTESNFEFINFDKKK